jgi:hypothetical protein
VFDYFSLVDRERNTSNEHLNATMKNKHGPNRGITGGFRELTASRGDPDIGKFKRGRAPCLSAVFPSPREGLGEIWLTDCQLFNRLFIAGVGEY